MSKTRLFALIMIGIIIGALLTNPKKEAFETALTDKAKGLLQEQLKYEDQDAVKLGMTLFGDKVVSDFIENNIVVNNYYLFSVVNLNWQGKIYPVGGGAFKQVWISPKIDEKAAEIIDVLKRL